MTDTEHTFFNDDELAAVHQALDSIMDELQTIQRRAHDFSKERFRKRIEEVREDLQILTILAFEVK